MCQANDEVKLWTYRKDLRRNTIRLVCLALISVGIAALANPRLAVIVAVIMALILIPLSLRERREIIELSDRELIYTSGSGETTRISFADMRAVDETSTIYWYADFSVVPAIRIVLKSNETKVFPLAFPDRPEIVSRIRGLIACQGNA
jgi:hypothetical protein